MSKNMNVPKLRFSEFSEYLKYKTLEEIAIDTISYGIVQTGDDIENGIPCVRVVDMTSTSLIIQNMIKTTEKISNSYNKTILKGNEVLFALRGEIGLCCGVPKNLIGANLTRGVARINPNKLIMNSDYLLQLLLTSKAKSSIMKEVNGSALKEIPLNGLRRVNLLFPAIREQEKIASFITSIDTKIEQLTKKESLLQEYKKGVMQKIFNQEIRFKADDGSEFCDWEEKKLKEIASFFSGGTPTSTNKNYYNGDIPFIGSGKINSNKVEQFITPEALESSSAKIVNVGDLLYALYGATSGQVAISKINGAINQAVLCIRSKENLAFMYYWLILEQDNIISTYLQGGQGNLSAQIIKNLKINLPCIEEQTKIANFLSSIDKKIENTKKELEKTKEFKKALLQQMFV